MPSFERLTNDLRKHCAKTPESRAYAEGYTQGKTRARLEVLALLVVVVLYFAAWHALPVVHAA